MNEEKRSNRRAGAKSDVRARGNGQLDLAEELRKAIARGSDIDYAQLRADLDAIADPSTKDWYAWAERTDRHIRRGALERD